MIYRHLLFIAMFFGISGGYSQILTGTLFISGQGCGCIAGCDLSAYGGPVCGAGVLGNCLAGHLAMSISIPVPDACEVTVTATMMVRPNGCTASGADGNSVTNDRLKVQGASLKSWTIGSNNASISDSHTQTGGTITVSGYSNRADEIITYAVYEEIPGCMMAFLPVTWGDINLRMEDEVCVVEWFTWSEINNAYFAIETSLNGIDFQEISRIPGNGTSLERNDYETAFSTASIFNNDVYVRLRQVDHNGQFSLSPVFHLPLLRKEELVMNYLPSDRSLELFIPEAEQSRYAIALYSAGGALLERVQIASAGYHRIALPLESRGFLIAVLEDHEKGVILTRKVPAW